VVWLIGSVYVIGWFLLCVSGMFTFVAMVRGKATYIQLAVPFLLIVGLPVYFSGGYLREDGVTEPLIFWIPAIVGGVCGAFAGFGVEISA